MLAGTVAPAAEPTARTENDSKMPSEVLEVLCTLETMENVNLQEEVLLAPDEVLEYARAYNGEFRLLYGRNMWIPELNAYTYDTYLPELQEIHTWLNPFNDPFRTMIPKVVEENMTPAQGIRSIAESGCTLLVLEGAQYENAEVRNALDQADNFVYLTETDEYVILQKRK